MFKQNSYNFMLFFLLMDFIPIVLAGGVGKRFWLLSRRNRPKQILPIFSEKPMIIETINRFKDCKEIFIVTNNKLKNKFKEMLPKNVYYVIEPVQRNTKAAICLACKKIREKYQNPIIVIASSDHYIKDISQFNDHIYHICEFIKKRPNKIALLGIRPLSPHLGYGYIKKARKISDSFYEIENFIEKPILKKVKDFVMQNDYYWNTGIMVGYCKTVLTEIKYHIPELYLKIMSNSINDQNILNHIYSLLPSISISRSVCEKSKNIVVFTSNLVWQDVGSFGNAKIYLPKDPNHNFSRKTFESLESIGNIIFTDLKPFLFGVSDKIIVETRDVILIVDIDQTENIPNILEKIPNEYK